MVDTSSLKIYENFKKQKISKKRKTKKRKKICGEEFFTKKNFKKIFEKHFFINNTNFKKL